MKVFKKFVMGTILLSVILMFGGCGAEKKAAEEYQKGVKTIGVAVYNAKDEEVMAFRNYYEGYISSSYPVEFIYSNNISTKEDEQTFFRQAKEAGAEGIISFVTYDLEAAVKTCEENQMYFMMGSGTVSQEDFDKVKENPYFIGVVGPDEEVERQAGSEMAAFFADSDQAGHGDYLIMSGGGCYGNVMHQYRTEGMLAQLAEKYGLEYPETVEKIALSEQPFTMVLDGKTVTVCPGYPSRETARAQIGELIKSGDYTYIMSVVPLTEFYDAIEEGKKANHMDITAGAIDCFTEVNQNAMHEGNLQYVTGKYEAIIGPSFAAMFDTVNGNGNHYREGGEAFRIHQGFWTARSEEEYDEMYAYAVSVYVNAFSCDDMNYVMKLYREDATFQDFKELAEAYTVEDVKRRRGAEPAASDT